MNTELVRAVFDCGIDDLRLLDDAECDMYAVIGRMREESIELTMNNIIRQVFEEGRYILTKAREDGVETLPLHHGLQYHNIQHCDYAQVLEAVEIYTTSNAIASRRIESHSKQSCIFDDAHQQIALNCILKYILCILLRSYR